ncbi:MAG TPA: FGGY family carbohydrate kinase, partial [Acidimicrobiales bacterium]|nr:FGGY family carbohydrate kinase [Acidimicrobiales bacterium]
MTAPQSGTYVDDLSARARPGRSEPASSGTLVAGVDVGTTSVKAVLVDETGSVVARHRLPSQLSVGPGGQFEHDAASTWWEGPRRALAGVLQAQPPGALRAVAVSAMMPSVGAVNVAGEPIGPGLLYGDGRRAPNVGAEDAPSFDGNDPTASDEMARLAGWAASHEPGASGFWPAQAVANASLGGEGVIDYASAMASGPLFNGSSWDEAACARAGLRP